MQHAKVEHTLSVRIIKTTIGLRIRTDQSKQASTSQLLKKAALMPVRTNLLFIPSKLALHIADDHLPEETILKDSKIITSAGRLAKRNEK